MKLKGSGNIADTWTNMSCFDLTDKIYNGFLKDTEFMAKVCMSSDIPSSDIRRKFPGKW